MKTTVNLPLAILFLLLSVLVSVTTSRAADYQSLQYAAAYDTYLQVSDEAGGSAKKMARLWEALAVEDESDPLAMVFLGSAHTLMGRDALMPWSKLNHTEKGLDEMALAIRLLKPEHDSQHFEHMTVTLQVKSIAAITFVQVPDSFGRSEDGFELLKEVLTDPAFIALPGEAKTYLYYYGIEAALAQEKDQQSAQWLSVLKTLNVDDDYTRAAYALEGAR